MWPSKEIEKLEDRVRKLERRRYLDFLVSHGAVEIDETVISIETWFTSSCKEKSYKLWIRDDETHRVMHLSKEKLRQLNNYLGKKLKEWESEEKK